MKREREEQFRSYSPLEQNLENLNNFPPKVCLKEVLKEKNAWIEVAISEGKSIPEPKYMPLIYKMVS